MLNAITLSHTGPSVSPGAGRYDSPDEEDYGERYREVIG